MLTSIERYEHFIYTISERFPSIRKSTLVFIRRGVSIGILQGQLFFPNDIVLRVTEALTFAAGHGRITRYSYEVWRGSEKLYWYDSQPHPDDPSLASTHPHHKHIPPDIKHHRVPAPGLSFTRSNLPFLIQEIEETLLRDSAVR